jgi:uncharacterized metal-binding protein
MNAKKTCQCSAAPKLIFSCSGAADVGEVADRAARSMTRDGSGRMYCLAGIGGRVSTILETTQAAQAILAIDGCSSNCASRSLEKAGFTAFQKLRLADLGMNKGQTPATEENINKVAGRGRQLLADTCCG